MIREYTEAMQGRYLRALKKEKGGSLDEFTQGTGYHRKVAIRSLRRRQRGVSSQRYGAL